MFSAAPTCLWKSCVVPICVDVKGDDMKPWIEAAKPLGDAKMQELYDAGNTHVFEVLDALNEAIDNYDGEFK